MSRHHIATTIVALGSWTLTWDDDAIHVLRTVLSIAHSPVRDSGRISAHYTSVCGGELGESDGL